MRYKLEDIQELAALTNKQIVQSFKTSGSYTEDFEAKDEQFVDFYCRQQSTSLYLTAHYRLFIIDDNGDWEQTSVYIALTEKGYEGDF